MTAAAAGTGATVRVNDAGSVRWIRFDRPENLNALRVTDIHAATAAVAGAPASVRAIVLTGTGPRAFSAGMHLDNFADLTPNSARALITTLAEFLAAVRNAPVVTVAAIHGYCLGAAFELALACDLRIATTQAQFGLPEIKLGIPSVIDSAMLQSYVGLAMAKEMVLTGDTYPAAALRCSGFLNRVVEPDALAAETDRLLSAVTGHTATAVASQKRLIEVWQNVGLAEAVATSVDEFAAVFEREETRERMAQYREARAHRGGTAPSSAGEPRGR